MKLVAFSAAMSILVCAGPDLSYAQSKCSAVKPLSSSNIEMAVARSALQKSLLLQFILTNKSSGKLYLKAAPYEQGSRASMDSGQEISYAEPSGIETTQGSTGAGCANNPGCSGDLNSFTELDPTNSLRFTYKFNSMTRMSESDAISLTVNLVARFAKASDEDGQAGSARLVKFHFNGIPLGC